MNSDSNTQTSNKFPPKSEQPPLEQSAPESPLPKQPHFK